jgi:hypothetical protein
VLTYITVDGSALNQYVQVNKRQQIAKHTGADYIFGLKRWRRV